MPSRHAQFADMVDRHPPVGDLQEAANGRTLLQSVPGQIAGVYATAMQGLQRWPDGFYAFLRAYRWATAREQDPWCAEEVYDDGVVLLWLTDQWQHPAFAPMREALHTYLRCECQLWAWGDGGRARILECFQEQCARATSLLPPGARVGQTASVS
ncbi:MAG TPA: hypothetical protein VLA19_14000 [Herpetosiphonaceae bacterium]|nr:hypothetical protein [Herpetosiphonaceae bacterium]